MIKLKQPKLGITVEAETEKEAKELLKKEIEKLNNPELKKKVKTTDGQTSIKTEKSTSKTSK